MTGKRKHVKDFILTDSQLGAILPTLRQARNLPACFRCGYLRIKWHRCPKDAALSRR